MRERREGQRGVMEGGREGEEEGGKGPACRGENFSVQPCTLLVAHVTGEQVNYHVLVISSPEGVADSTH